jgi:hypothetical protein
MPRKIVRLRKEAEGAAAARGHALRWDPVYVTRFLSPGARERTGLCRHTGCSAWVNITDRPLPNGIEIGGSAVALNCPHTRD